jgi:tetratricopeptide (TPR) repeat protein
MSCILNSCDVFNSKGVIVSYLGLFRKYFACAIILSLFSSGLLAGDNKKEKDEENKLPPEKQVIVNSFLRLEMGIATKSDRNKLRKISRNKKHLFLAAPLLGQYEREFRKRPLKSLYIIAPYLYMNIEDSKMFIENIKKYYNDIKRSKKNKDKENNINPILEIPSLDEVNVNSPWHCIEASRAFMAIGRYQEAIKTLDSLGRNSNGFSRVMAAEAAGDVFAMQRQWSRADEWYRSALRFYKAWLNAPPLEDSEEVVEIISNDAGSSIEKFLEDSIISRIILKCDETKRLVDMEYYGPGYYLYKEAETARIEDKDYRYAIVVYDEIIKSFEKTIYGEAAKAYKVLCYFELAKASKKELYPVESQRLVKLMKSEIAEYEKLLSKTDKKADEDDKYTQKDLEKRVSEIKKQKERIPWWTKRGSKDDIAKELVRLVNGDGEDVTPEQVNNQKANPVQSNSSINAEATLSDNNANSNDRNNKKDKSNKENRSEVIPESYGYNLFRETRDEKFLRRSKRASRIATGKRAEVRAFRYLKELLDKQYYGLYRGELMLATADYLMEFKLDIDSAEKWYDKSAQWLSKVEDLEDTLTTFIPPDQVQYVCKPPAEERYSDFWGNVNLHEINPGIIIHRRTCCWYLNSQRKRVLLMQGFMAFLKKDYKQAEECWDKLYKLDSYFMNMEMCSFGSVISRMKWNIKHNKGCVYATPKEMKEFKNCKRRKIVMIADLAFENEEHEKAGLIYEQLLKGKYGRPSRGEAAYLTYALSDCCMMTKRRKEAFRLLEDFEIKFRGTPTVPRALLARGARLVSNYQPEEIKLGIKDYRTIVEHFPKSHEYGFALHHWGEILLNTGNIRKGKKIFELYMKKFPEKGPFNAVVRNRLKELKGKGNIDKGEEG